MQIIIKQKDIEQAITEYIASQGIKLIGKEVEINFTAGRKDSGISAEIDIEEPRLGRPIAEVARNVALTPTVEKTTVETLAITPPKMEEEEEAVASSNSSSIFD